MKSKSHTFKNKIIIISKDEKIVDVAGIERGKSNALSLAVSVYYCALLTNVPPNCIG